MFEMILKHGIHSLIVVPVRIDKRCIDLIQLIIVQSLITAADVLHPA